MAEICVRAVLAVADLERRDVNLDLIKVSEWGGATGIRLGKSPSFLDGQRSAVNKK
jgi:hypothetical protein